MNVSTELRKLPWVDVHGYCSTKVSDDKIRDVVNFVIRRVYLDLFGALQSGESKSWDVSVILDAIGWAMIPMDKYVDVLRSPSAKFLRVNKLEASSRRSVVGVASFSSRGLAVVPSNLFDRGVLVGEGQVVKISVPSSVKGLSDVQKFSVEVGDVSKVSLFR